MSNENALTIYNDPLKTKRDLYQEFMNIKTHFSNLTDCFEQLAQYFNPDISKSSSPQKPISRINKTNFSNVNNLTESKKEQKLINTYNKYIHYDDINSMNSEQIKKYIERTLIDNLEDQTKDKTKELMKIKMKKKSIISSKKLHKNVLMIQTKVYPVKIESYNKTTFGFRILVSFANYTVCYGPYSDYNFSMNLSQTIQLELNKFDHTHPNICYLSKIFLSYSKFILEKKYKPLKTQKK